MFPTRECMAKAIFEEVRDQPYRVSEFIGDPAFNCSFKGKQLLEQLGALGLPVRGRVAEMLWENTLIPKEIVSLYPKEILATHFFVEIQEDDIWRPLDPSWDKALEKAGFAIATWKGENTPAFPLEKVYEPEEQASYIKFWKNHEYAENYYAKANRFLKAVNVWLKEVRGCS